MTAHNRISVSFNDQEFETLEVLSAHTHKTKAELIRTCVEEFLRDNPNRFRRKTKIDVNRQHNIVQRNLEHEMRTPLNAIIGFSEIVRSGICPERNEEYAEVIRESGAHLLTLVNGLLALAQLEADDDDTKAAKAA